MHNTTEPNNISIEKFAAFLDGNLAEEEMRTVEMAIDTNSGYSDIIRDILNIEDSVDLYLQQDNLIPEELLDPNLELPVVPVPSIADDFIETFAENKENSGTVEFIEEDKFITDAYHASTSNMDTTVSNAEDPMDSTDNHYIFQPMDDTMDFDDV